MALETKVDYLVNYLEKNGSVISSCEQKYNHLEKKIMDLEVNFEVKKIETSEDSEKKLNNEVLKCEKKQSRRSKYESV